MFGFHFVKARLQSWDIFRAVCFRRFDLLRLFLFRLYYSETSVNILSLKINHIFFLNVNQFATVDNACHRQVRI